MQTAVTSKTYLAYSFVNADVHGSQRINPNHHQQVEISAWTQGTLSLVSRWNLHSTREKKKIPLI